MVQQAKLGQDFRYEWVKTKDNSLTLKSISEPSEWMHSLQGAYAESQFIYGEALRHALSLFDKSKTLNILSMGLGLGYLEWIAVLECHKAEQPFQIHSYELDETLQNLFKDNIILAKKLLSNQSEDHGGYEVKYLLKVKDFEAGYLDYFVNDYGKILVSDILVNDWPVKHHGPFEKSEFQKKSDLFHLIFYDAFSSNSQSELWNEFFLSEFIQNKSDPNFCIFSTYAKVGSLNRALKQNNFTITEKKGFAHKRQSTFAQRISK